jgi:hypothetical protein
LLRTVHEEIMRIQSGGIAGKCRSVFLKKKVNERNMKSATGLFNRELIHVELMKQLG